VARNWRECDGFSLSLFGGAKRVHRVGDSTSQRQEASRTERRDDRLDEFVRPTLDLLGGMRYRL
jgi:hypothetical protein